CFLRYAMMLVTRENGTSRDPYPPTTVSLLTKPRSDFTSARTTRMIHLDGDNDQVSRRNAKNAKLAKHTWLCSLGGLCVQAAAGGPRGDRGENETLREWLSTWPTRNPIGRRLDSVPSCAVRRAG